MTKKPTCEVLEQRVKGLESQAADFAKTENEFDQTNRMHRALIEAIPDTVYFSDDSSLF